MSGTWAKRIFYLYHLCVYVALSGVLAILSGCGDPLPDQSQFQPLDVLAETNQAVVRIYGAPVPLFYGAIHTWFAVKRADATTFDRWEVWVLSGDPYGFVWKNLFAPDAGIGGGNAKVIAELIGPEADPIIDFIETESPSYPYDNHYVFFPGPNSNSYTEWVIENSHWDVKLPDKAIGWDALPKE